MTRKSFSSAFLREGFSLLAAFLVGYECLSGKIACVPCRDKSGVSWEKSITKMLEESFSDIRCIVSDRDAVATSEKFRRSLKVRYNIDWVFLPLRGKAFFAELAVKILKTKLSVALLANPEERDWTKFVEDAVRSHNSEKIEGTDVVRSSVNKYNYVSLLSKLYKSKNPTMLFNISSGSNVSPETSKQIWNLKVGDRVLLNRKVTNKNVFEKASVKGHYGKTVYSVKKRLWKTSSDFYIVPVYELDKIAGKFYESELLPILF